MDSEAEGTFVSLAHYQTVTERRCAPLWQQCKGVPCSSWDWASLSDEELWQLHGDGVQGLDGHRRDDPGFATLFDLKTELARRNLRACALCPWRCRVNRADGERGRCGVGGEAWVFREGLLVAEEEFLIPTHELFLTGCNIRCVFCQAWEGVAETRLGFPLSSDGLCYATQHRFEQGAANIHWVGGEPTVSLLAVLESLRDLDLMLPVVWNTNLYVTDKTMQLFHGLVDLFVADFKFGNDDCASQLSGARDYVATLEGNLLAASGMASLVVRHLVMPGHVECCLEPVACWVAEHLADVPFHLMLNYVPDWKGCEDPVLGKSPSALEQRHAQALVKAYRLNLVE